MWYYIGWSVYLIYFKIFLKLKVFGRKNVPAKGAFIFASNHASYFDPPLIGTSVKRQIAYMARDTLFRTPLSRWALRKVRAFPVRREEGDTRAIRDALSILKSGFPLVLFPEGSRTEDGELKSAKPGIGFIVAKANVPVVPVYIKGSFEAWPKGAKRVNFVPVSVHIGEPIEFDPGELEAKGRDDSPIYSLGSIIHNKQVVQDLSKRGLKVVKAADDIKKGACVISSHGISPRIAKSMSDRGIKIIDTTCPFVLKAQKIAKSMSDSGYNVIIVGDAGHPEVRALVDFVSKKAFVVKDAEEAKPLELEKGGKYIVISQTTQSTQNFLKVVELILSKRPKELKVYNTICRDAEVRQEAARKLARSQEAMLVVGGKNSANTRRLLEVCQNILINSHLVETEEDLRKRWFKDIHSVGITSGASTPDWIVKKVVKAVKKVKL
jgi:4-hydroxy-3-methylbut-2-en-1-yl diphosphate reductase